MGLKLLLDRAADGAGILIVIPYSVVGTAADGQPIEEPVPGGRPPARRAQVSEGLDLSIGLTDFGEFTLLIAKRDPGRAWSGSRSRASSPASPSPSTGRVAGSGRAWHPDGRLGIVWRSDRYVDVEREFGRLLDQLVAVRRPTGAAVRASDGARRRGCVARTGTTLCRTSRC